MPSCAPSRVRAVRLRRARRVAREEHARLLGAIGVQEDRRVRLLTQPNQNRALYVAAQKKTREDYKRLRALWR